MAASTSWQQIAVGRLIAGAGVGALSIMVPMYVSETGPRQVRGALVSTYQLFITLGIFVADAINFGTEARHDSGSWRIPMGIGFIWPLILGIGILAFPESPRFAYRHGRINEARTTMAKFYGVSESHREVRREIAEIKAKHDLEISLGKRPWIELLTGPRMAYRTLLGITLQALQQLTGADFCWIKRLFTPCRIQLIGSRSQFLFLLWDDDFPSYRTFKFLRHGYDSRWREFRHDIFRPLCGRSFRSSQIPYCWGHWYDSQLPCLCVCRLVRAEQSDAAKYPTSWHGNDSLCVLLYRLLRNDLGTHCLVYSG